MKLRAAVGAVLLATTPLVAQCAPTTVAAPTCTTQLRTTFGATWCNQNGTRARLTYFSPLYGWSWKQSVGPCVSANHGSFAYVPDPEIVAGSFGLKVVWERC